jgi:hypothetical protein
MTGGFSDGSECWISSKALGAKLDPICGKIKNEREAISLVRMFLSARENAQRCAVDCAPYVHAKLQAVHHEHGSAVRYIIADRPMTEAEWIAARRRKWEDLLLLFWKVTPRPTTSSPKVSPPAMPAPGWSESFVAFTFASNPE